jgi:hypothetical protein
MIEMLKRHEIQVLRRAGHSLPEVAKLAGVSVRSVQRVEDDDPVTSVDNEPERVRRRIGRPAKAEPFRSFVVEQLTGEPDLLSVEILQRPPRRWPGRAARRRPPALGRTPSDPPAG